MSVHLCIERSELSQTVWLILFLSTLSVGSLVMLVYQGHRSWLCQDFFTIDTRSLSFIFSYNPRISFDDGNLLFLTPCAHDIPSSAGFTGIVCQFQFKFARQWWHLLYHIPRRYSVSFVVWHWPDLPQSRSSSQLWGGHQEVNHGQLPTESEWAGSEPSTLTVHPASDWQIPCCCNNLPRGEDVKNLLMLRWEPCMHERF